MTNVVLRNINSVPLHRLEILITYRESEYVKVRVCGETFYMNEDVPELIDFREILEDEADSPFLVFIVVRLEELYKIEMEKGWFSSSNVQKTDTEFIQELIKIQDDFHHMIMDVGAGGCYIVVDCGNEYESKKKEVETLLMETTGILASSSIIDTMIEVVSNWKGVETI